MKKDTKKIIKIIFSILIITTLFICIEETVNILKIKKEEKQVLENNKEMQELLVSKDEPVEEEKEEEETETKDLSDLEYYRSYYNNNDIIGTLKIDGTNIYTLLPKTTNNKYYLSHSLSRRYDGYGSIFVDYRTDLSSKQINIYGHNSNYTYYMFKELENYLNKDFYQNHKYIKLWNGTETATYEIFSIQIITDDYEHIVVNPSDPMEHIEKLKKSIYETGVDVNANDKLLILQTCSYNPRNSFLIINSKKV